MAVPMTFTSLRTQIKNYANRFDDFFDSNINDFIQQGILRIYNEALNIGFEKVFPANVGNLLTVNQAYINRPTDWMETVSIQYTIPATTTTRAYTKFLLPRSYEFCLSYWPDPTKTGEPLFYADYGNAATLGNQGASYNRFYICPTPDKNYVGSLIYLGLPLFNQANQTNFLTERYPSLLLYASLMESIPLLRSDERIPVFESLYNRELQNINRLSQKRYIDRTSKRDKD